MINKLWIDNCSSSGIAVEVGDDGLWRIRSEAAVIGLIQVL